MTTKKSTPKKLEKNKRSNKLTLYIQGGLPPGTGVKITQPFLMIFRGEIEQRLIEGTLQRTKLEKPHQT